MLLDAIVNCKLILSRIKISFFNRVVYRPRLWQFFIIRRKKQQHTNKQTKKKEYLLQLSDYLFPILNFRQKTNDCW